MTHSITKPRSYVYFIQDTYSKNIKIGISRNPVKRLQGLQTAHAYPLQLLKTVPGGETKERELHQRFADARLGGEWFAPTDGLLSYIAGKDIRQIDGDDEAMTDADDEVTASAWLHEVRLKSSAMLFWSSAVFLVGMEAIVLRAFIPDPSFEQQIIAGLGAFLAWLLFVRWYFR